MSINESQLQSSRRHFLARNAMGIGGVALTWLLQKEGLLAKPIKPELASQAHSLLPKRPHHEPRAKAMISLFMQGGPSQMDLCDPKPMLDEWAGRDIPVKLKYDNAAGASAQVLPSSWKFKKHGQSGIDFSELLPGFGEIADELCLIRSMHTGVNNHGQSIHALNSGRTVAGRPSLGSWLTYGLGAESQNLPAYLVLRDPASLPVEGTLNWSAGWLPGLYQGTVVRAREPRILNLDAPANLRSGGQRNYLDFLGNLNRKHSASHPGELDLEARIASFELAARMQTSASDAMDISGESPATKKLYGIDDDATKDYGTRCLIARRLVERGVRFVHVLSGNQSWDHHHGIKNSLPKACKKTDRPIAGLIKDLKGLGLLDSTVVHWGGEMGRLPVVQNTNNAGRDHNTYGFSMWLAGGGFKAGHIHGDTDEWGHRSVRDKVNHYDYHATLLRLFGLDQNQLNYKRGGQVQSLIDGQPARLIEEVLA
ncbi:MAG: DUF1501 domain-containing protein [Verrucomicrobia bacterium]|nr:DUF1501 domain-containing protein [Verrucomicrobiota bacterium]